MFFLAPLLLSAAVLPEVRVVQRDARGCGVPVLAASGTVLRLPRPVCVRQAWTAHLEDEDTMHLVAQVDMSGELRVFIYTMADARVEPRFLGSGFASLRLVALRRGVDGGQDVVELDGMRGPVPVRLHCRFQGFPLVCQER